MERLAYKPLEAAQQLNIGRDAIYGLIQDGKLRTIRLGKSTVRIPRDELERFVRDQIESASAA